MNKSRRAVKVPRRKAGQENQAPTLIIVKDCNSECYRQSRTSAYKTNVLGSAVLQSKTKYFSL